jgi:hypothetical protein
MPLAHWGGASYPDTIIFILQALIVPIALTAIPLNTIIYLHVSALTTGDVMVLTTVT